jgi:ubiquinone/menaquinone biosynthesis C-methylase UbiE
MFKKRQATEQVSHQEALARMDATRTFAKRLVARLSRIWSLAPGAKIVDVGAAQGQLVIALRQMGFDAMGVEPWAAARQLAQRLGEHEQCAFPMLDGTAESLPVQDGSCDVLVAANVIEHVLDADAAFREAARVLRVGGIFWFSAASSMCPHQEEISAFPFFGWYPDLLKRRIMSWAKERKPHLVGHTKTPAINWFTPWKAHRMLHAAGFSRVYDRYDLRLPSEGGTLYRLALRLLQNWRVAKLLADLMGEGCVYAAVK